MCPAGATRAGMGLLKQVVHDSTRLVSLMSGGATSLGLHGRRGLISRFLGGRSRGTAVGELPFLDACPEGVLVDLELVAEEVAPDGRAVRRPVGWMRDPGPQHLPIPEDQFVSDVVSSGATLGVPDSLPTF